ncbi:DNA polymerase/3'-5' exonuclease PolX [Humisphaera borealis]|uniref:DNA-directed DNA polymerase n=1 Tax=Humisphaera borealis TaxID=2807512 RepID=A0A7M2WUY2_9BACT|nr:DNA polymerase/3'-5' exonuclease PolX [Humisphaera borealis]QOV88631.1 DNA polymerase/3'-5' exonuclease PolX [Humisphaera borealis]
MSLNNDLSELFKNFSRLMELKGESVFKVIAFQKVSRILNDMTFDIRQAFEKGELDSIEGIGESSRRIISEFIRTGRSTEFDEVATTVPAGLLPMLDIQGLGPKTIALFWKEKGITSVDALVKAIDDGSLKGLKGVGDKKLLGIKEALERMKNASGRLRIDEAMSIATDFVERLRKLPEVAYVEYAGSLRRSRETIGDVDLICSGKSPDDGEAIAKVFTQFPEVSKILGQGTTKASILTARGFQIDIRIVPQENFGAALLYFTGSKEHNVRLRGRAIDQGMTLNEWGLYKQTDYDKAQKKTGEAPDAKPVASKTESDVYRKLGLQFIAPEMREDRGEIDAAETDTLPTLIELSDVRGDLHCHTTASDGRHTIEQMVEAAIEMGYAFLAITDHSKSQVQAHGLSVERLLAHVKAIHDVGRKYKEITLFAGCEVDILADGRLDYEDEVLAELDFIVASPHHALTQNEAKATDRIVRAIEHKYVNVIGHPTGRRVEVRAPLPLQFDRVFKAAAAAGTALEINANADRLDLNDVNARAAAQAGVKISINTDSHDIASFPDMRYGIGVARRAWLTAGDVINCMDVKALKKFIAAKR